MRHGSLFSGIGGFELAAEWMGWQNTFHCEFNEFGSKVLSHYWPESKHYGDITKSDFSEFRDRIDILTGGFPCQPYSAAGKRKGKDDARHLWPEMLRVIREVRPRYIVGENVYGLVTWNGGLVFDEVCTDLEAEGYAVWPIVIPAAAVGAPHRRDRVWFVAYSACKCERANQFRCLRCQNGKIKRERSQTIYYATRSNGIKGLTTDPESVLLQRQCIGQRQGKFRRGNWDGFPTESPVCSGDDGIPSELDGITFPKWRNESIKAYGNAIVPQVAYQIFKAIEDHDYRAMA
jgi:DNA (cytosine-5)-methyltransferase 1